VWRIAELIAEMTRGWGAEVVFLDYDNGHYSGGGDQEKERENECSRILEDNR